MKNQIIFLLGALFIYAGPLQAQENQSKEDKNQSLMLVSYFKCTGLEQVTEQLVKEDAPILNKMVENGQLMDWGVMNHHVGDAWNLVLYYVGSDLGAIEQAYEKYLAVYQKKHPKGLEQFDKSCTEHKDNIYRYVAGYQGERTN